MLLPNQTLGKSFVSQEQEQKDRNFAEEELEGHHAVNGMSVIRGKRALSDYLKDYCVPANNGYPSRGCVKAWNDCKGFTEVVCATYTSESSRACNRNIALYGFPKCFPNYEWVSIDTPQGTKKVKRTKSCSCTQ